MAQGQQGPSSVVYRTDLIVACRECEFARKCLGERVTARTSPWSSTAAAERRFTFCDSLL